MGFGELCIKLGIDYESKDAIKLADKLGAFVQQHALSASQDLAKERGPFRDWNEQDYPYEARRNALLMAIAPTASISNICGTSSGIETYFANVCKKSNNIKFVPGFEIFLNKLFLQPYFFLKHS